MKYRHIQYPEAGTQISVVNGRLHVPDDPILGFVEGDGIGPDITRACLRIWDAAVEQAYGGRRKIHWMELFMGEKAAEKYDGDFFPEEAKEALKDIVVSIKGPLTTPVGGGFRSLNVALRQDLDLYACVRPVRYYPGVPSPLRAPELVDVVIYRENTEDVYAGIEYRAGSPEARKLEAFLKTEFGAEFFEDSGLGIKPMSAFGSKRLVRKAIRYALDNGRESVTLVHKGNIQKYTEGAFRQWGYEVAREEFADETVTEADLFSVYGGKRPEGRVVIKDRIADIMFQLMLLRPNEFDVIATTNLNGDYLSDAIAAEVGGVGIAPGANMADHVAVFEATHGTAPKYANLDKVNPGSLLFSGVMMLEYLGWKEAADLITFAFPEVIQKKIVTYDFARLMAGAKEVSTSGFASALIEEMGAGVDLEARRAEHDRAIEEERREREARRVAEPIAEMQASGRTPHPVGDIASPVMTVKPKSNTSGTMDGTVQPALAGRRVSYERRRPEDTVLYQLVQEHLETFLAQVELETGAGLPDFVQEELDAFLECGILAHGFLRLRCADCAHEKLVAFSCKRRGFCPSCGARRMAETAAHLVDHVIPRVPVRQWVLSFPIPLRLLFATHPELLAPVLQIVHRVIATFLIQQAGLQRTEAHTGAVTLIQRFGSAANLNIHLHCLVLDGVYRTTEGLPVFHEVRAPTAEQLQTLLARIITRLMKFLTRKGFLIEEQGMSYLADTDPDTALGPLRAAACTYRIALGPRAGQKVLSLQTVPTREPPLTPVRCVDEQGFSLHAEVCCAAHERHKLEHLCRYITRPAIANERLTLNRAGDVVLQLKSPYHDGTTHIVMSPLELMQRLAALVPRPRLHLIRFHGVLAPNAKLRPEIIPSSGRQAGDLPVPGFPSAPVNTPNAAAVHADAPHPYTYRRL